MRTKTVNVLSYFKRFSASLAHKIPSRYSGLASTYPEPADKEAFIKAQLYDFTYDDKSALPDVYEWPQLSKY
jgi:hypothetical protein